MSLKRAISKDISIHAEGNLNLSTDANNQINIKSPLVVESNELQETIRTNLGLQIGKDIQKYSEKLNDISDGNFQNGEGIVWKDGKFQPVNITALNDRVQKIETYLSIFTQTYTITDSNGNLVSFDFT